VGLEKIIQRRLGNRVMGFGAVEDGKRVAEFDRDEVLQHVEPEDLISYGFIPEFIGRLPMVTVLEQLTEEHLLAILSEPKNALIKQYTKLMALEGVSLDFTQDALRELASVAFKKGTGARALRGILERLMLDIMFDVPSSDIVDIKITQGVVRGDTKPLIRRKSDKAAA
ncbi:MAG TPA: ATP-dependent Clp protease ATP-binding subunit ClpX, partial [Verrucomicrobiae bacterium]